MIGEIGRSERPGEDLKISMVAEGVAESPFIDEAFISCDIESPTGTDLDERGIGDEESLLVFLAGKFEVGSLYGKLAGGGMAWYLVGEEKKEGASGECRETAGTLC